MNDEVWSFVLVEPLNFIMVAPTVDEDELLLDDKLFVVAKYRLAKYFERSDLSDSGAL